MGCFGGDLSVLREIPSQKIHNTINDSTERRINEQASVN